MKRFSILFVLSIFSCILNAQPLVLPKIDQPPRIDGHPDELIWQQAALFSAFTTIQPDYGLQPSETTELRLAKAMARFLMTDESAWTTGQVIGVDGGCRPSGPDAPWLQLAAFF